MLALQVYEDSRCEGCGGNLTETTAPEREGRYRVTAKVRCHACDVLGAAAEQHEKSGAKRMHALRWRVRYVPRRSTPGG